MYVHGLLSDLQRKNVEAIALKQGVRPRTLQRFLESIKWDHDQVLRRCRKIVVKEQADPDAIDVIDETGTAKSGNQTVGVKRQYNGNRGKVENAVVSVALIVARNVRTGETKYFISNRVPGRGGWTLRALLRVAFGRWKVEAVSVKRKKSWAGITLSVVVGAVCTVTSS